VQPIQIAALKYLSINCQKDTMLKLAFHIHLHPRRLQMKVVFGDEFYCCLNKEVIAATNCEDDCAKVSSARVYHDAYL